MSKYLFNKYIVLFTVAVVSIMTTVNVYAQNSPQRRYKVVEGVLREIVVDTVPAHFLDIADSVVVKPAAMINVNPGLDEKPQKERRDTSTVRYSKIFRDSIPLSRMSAISLIAPGFSQLYNKQAWKIPILYGTVGALGYFGFKQNGEYRNYKRQYDALVRQNASRDVLDPVQSQMIKHNTSRTILLAGAFATYIYFIGEGAVNYNGAVNSVKKATTLSTIFPGAGQFYNRSYWKVPIVVGAFATMGYIIDYNGRGFNRYKLAYDIVTDGDPNTVDEFNGRYSADHLKNLKDSYRRNRDLSIIITCGLYLLNIVDAHVDAHLKDFDISDDLAMRFEPTLVNLCTSRTQNVNGIGMAFSLKF